MNEAGNEAGSVTVVLPGLAKMRSAHGYDTPIGHRCSNILEMLDAGAKRSDIAVQVAELAALTMPKGNRA